MIHAHIPKHAKIVHVAFQPDKGFVLWADVDTTIPTVERSFCIYGTGWGVPDGGTYRGTLFQDEFVWHVVEV